MKRISPMTIGIPGVFFLCGAAMIWFAIMQFQGTDAFLQNARKTNGIVASNPISCEMRNARIADTASNSNRSGQEQVCTYKPTIEYSGDAGTAETKQTRYGRGSYDFDEGSEIRILVNADFDYVLLAEEHRQNEVGLILLIFGSILCVPLIFVMFFIVRPRLRKA